MITTDISFTSQESEVLNLLLSLSDNPEFKNVKPITRNSVELTYDGGYNNVHNHTCKITIVECKPIHNKFFWWTFQVESDEKTTMIDSDTFTGCLSFMDFFIDEYIKEIGNIQQQN